MSLVLALKTAIRARSAEGPLGRQQADLPGEGGPVVDGVVLQSNYEERLPEATHANGLPTSRRLVRVRIRGGHLA